MNIKPCCSRLMFKSRWVNNPSVANKRIEDEFIQDYFSKHEFYFKSMLGKRLGSRNYLIESDMFLLKEAYDKAHQKSNFEIELHWKRTTHIWTLILALMIATGTLLGFYLSSVPNKKDFLLSGILFFSVICIVVSQISLSILKVSHKWCNNWESHIVMLEPLFAGMLYQTHIGMGKKRLSISKLNTALVWIAIISWIFIFQLSIFLLSNNVRSYIIITFSLYCFISLSGLLAGHAISSKDEGNITSELTQYSISTVANNGFTTSFFNGLKSIASQYLYTFIFLTLALTFLYITERYFFNVTPKLNDFHDVLNLEPRITFPFLY